MANIGNVNLLNDSNFTSHEQTQQFSSRPFPSVFNRLPVCDITVFDKIACYFSDVFAYVMFLILNTIMVVDLVHVFVVAVADFVVVCCWWW